MQTVVVVVVMSLKVVRMVNLHVMTALAYLDLGNVMYTIVIVLDAKMKPIAAVAVLMLSLNVPMAVAYLQATTVTVLQKTAMPDGVLTALTALMKY
jgi:hypothetical protein